MQVKIMTLAIPALALFAFAQTQDPSQSRRQDTTGQQETTGQESRTETESGTTMSGERSQTGQEPVRQSRTGEHATAKARTYKGTLVDSSCARNMAATGTTGQAPSAERMTTEEEGAARTAEEQARQQTRTDTGVSTTGAASRVDAKAISQSCPITSSTTDFALVMNDGRLMELNAEGDAKVASQLKTNNKWNRAINENKRITASVKGTLEGDTLQVESVK